MAVQKTLVEKPRKAGVERAKEHLHLSNGQKMLGEIVTWNAKSDKEHSYTSVTKALSAVGLDPDVAKKIMPQHAFSRACKELEEAAIFDIVRNGQDEVRFQLTKKTLTNEEWEYAKDTELTLNKTTGVVICKKKNLEAAAQKLVIEYMEARNTSDITKVVQTLFEENSEIFPIRDQGGAYFIPKEKLDFVYKVEEFLEKLGGRLNRFAIAAGSEQSNTAVKNSMADTILKVVKEHEEAIESFTLNTRADTMAAQGVRIKESRVKVEAYSHYLKERSEELLKVIDKANKKLKIKIDGLNEERKTAPPSVNQIFGYGLSKILMWMGRNDWSYQEAKAVLTTYGAVVQDTTIRGQLWCGASHREKYVPAELEDKQIAELEKRRKAYLKGAK